MIKLAHGLATATLAAGLVLGTAGAALADTDMASTSGQTLMSTPFNQLTISQLKTLKGQEVYDMGGGHVGKILRLVRGQNTDQLYYVLKGYNLMGATNEMAAIPVDQLHWQGNQIIAKQRFPDMPAFDGGGNLPLWNFAYTGDTWTPHQG